MHPPEGFEYIAPLGYGQATTWIGRSKEGQDVVVKTLELQRVSDWKGIELFEREISTLQQLDHPCIPKFIRFISDEYEGAKRWHIVQEKVNGDTIESLISTSRFSEERITKIAEQVLNCLVFLQSYSPPLLHRDIKPSNLMWSQGKIFLIDFGSVRHVVPSRIGGSTVVGTSGYMAPEQLMGRADMSSDLYGLGMTLIHILTQTNPDELPKKRMKVIWEDALKVSISQGFKTFVNKLTEPHPENRFPSAADALNGIHLSAPPASLIPKTGSTMLTISEPNSRSVLAKGYGTSLDLSSIQSVLGMVAVGLITLLFVFTLIFLIVLPIAFLMWWFATRTTHTLFTFQDEKLKVEKGWLFKSCYEVPLPCLLELEDTRRYKAPFELEGQNITGPLSYRERMELKEKLQFKASSFVNIAEENGHILGLAKKTQEEEVLQSKASEIDAH